MIKNFSKLFNKTVARVCANVPQQSYASSGAYSKKLGIGEASVVLEEKIKNISQLNDIKEFGTVISIGDGIARVFGLTKV